MNYKTHPVADMFPLLVKGSRPYNDLEESIRAFGQLEPIVLDGDVLLDGRNRLAICEANGIKPKVVQWSEMGIKSADHEWIFAKNASRRNMTEDQRVAVLYEYNEWVLKGQTEAKKDESKFNEGNPGGPGRGHKTVTQVSESPFTDQPAKPKRDRIKSNRNTTAGMLAEQAGVSRYTAQQIISLGEAAKAGNEQAKSDFQEIKKGMKTLRQAAKPKSDKPKKEKPKHPGFDKLMKAWKSATDEERTMFRKEIQ